MSAKWLLTFKYFKFPLLPLLTHSAMWRSEPKWEMQPELEFKKSWAIMLKISKCKAIFSLWPIKRKKTWSGSPQCSSSSLALSSSCWTPALTHCRPQQTSCAGNTPHPINANSVEIVAQQITTWTVAKWCLTQTATHGDTTTLSISLWPMWTQVSKFTVICQAGKPQEEEPSQQSCVWQISSQILSSSTQQRRSCTFLNWQSHWPQILTRETVKRAESMHHL